MLHQKLTEHQNKTWNNKQFIYEPIGSPDVPVGDAKKQKGQGDPDKAGDTQGEEYYEVEITLEELSHYLFKDLELPDLEKKALKN